MSPEDLVYSYSRRQAIADGVLLDVTAMAQEAGLRYPVALTAAAWAECVTWRVGADDGQCESGRLWDVLFMARLAARQAAGSTVQFSVRVVPERRRAPKEVWLKTVVGPGDALEPVITIMMLDED